jgi:polysaccharide transporter, PST family
MADRDRATPTPGPGDDTIADVPMSDDEVRRRAVSGAVVVAVRGVALRMLTFGGSLVLARLLVPSEFGIIALGASLLIAANFFTGGGLGAALIRRREPPRRTELNALLGIQLVAAIVIAALVVVVGMGLGKEGQVVAIMVTSLPLMVLRTPGGVLLERQLAYRRLVLVELAESVSYYGFGIAMVAIGWGVWGLASAAVLRAAVASIVIVVVAPDALGWPTLRFRRLRGLMGFGIKMQALGLNLVIFEQTMNMGIAAIGGLSMLGIWALAKRIIEAPSVLFQALWRVSFPAMSRLRAAGVDLRPTIERGVALGGVMTGAIMLFLVGGGPSLIPLVFGSQWKDAADVVPWAALGTMISGPVSVATAGYLYAVGDASAVLRSGILMSAVWLALGLGLLEPVGIAAPGIGLLVGSCVDAYVLGSATARHSGAKIVEPLVRPGAAAVVAGTVGWWLASTSSSWQHAVLGIAVAQAIFVGSLLVLDRDLVLDVVRIPRRALKRRGISGEPSARPAM